MIERFFLAFIPVFVAIDPIGLVAVFMGLGTNASGEHRKQQAFLGIFTAFCVAIGFIFLGKIIFAALGITVADFQVAGGLILLGLAGRELLGLGAARDAADRRACTSHRAADFGRYGRPRLYANLASGKPCTGCDRVL